MVQDILFAFLVGVNIAIPLLVAALAVAGLITHLRTDADAYYVIDRDKTKWTLLLVGATVASLASAAGMLLILWFIAAVIVGLYWQDVRPAIRDVLDNSSGY